MPQTQTRPVQTSLHCDRKSLLDAWATRVRSHYSDSVAAKGTLLSSSAFCTNSLYHWLALNIGSLFSTIGLNPLTSFPVQKPIHLEANMQENGRGLYKSWRISKRPPDLEIKLFGQQAVESLFVCALIGFVSTCMTCHILFFSCVFCFCAYTYCLSDHVKWVWTDMNGNQLPLYGWWWFKDFDLLFRQSKLYTWMLHHCPVIHAKVELSSFILQIHRGFTCDSQFIITVCLLVFACTS